MIHSNTTGLLSGYCANIPQNSTVNGTDTVIWQCNDNPQQNWTVQYSAYGGNDDWLQIVGQNGQCLADAYDGATNGTPVWTWNCNGDEAQAWFWVSYGPGQDQVEWYNPNGLCINLTGDNNSNGTKLQMWNCLFNNQEAWLGP